jgi:hypothetical protein
MNLQISSGGQLRVYGTGGAYLPKGMMVQLPSQGAKTAL